MLSGSVVCAAYRVPCMSTFPSSIYLDFELVSHSMQELMVSFIIKSSTAIVKHLVLQLSILWGKFGSRRGTRWKGTAGGHKGPHPAPRHPRPYGYLYCFPSSSPLFTLIVFTASKPLRGRLSHLVSMIVNQVMMKVNHTDIGGLFLRVMCRWRHLHHRLVLFCYETSTIS